jgi:hypothetical protein
MQGIEFFWVYDRTLDGINFSLAGPLPVSSYLPRFVCNLPHFFVSPPNKGHPRAEGGQWSEMSSLGGIKVICEAQ